jgi:hypothetical protein
MALDPEMADTANDLLAQLPCRMVTGVVAAPGGPQLMVLTIRTGSATLTVLLEADEAKAWGAQITSQAKMMSKSGLTVVKALIT